MATVTIPSCDAQFDCDSRQSLLDAALEAGLTIPHNCRSGSCGECKARVIAGETVDGDFYPYALDEDEIADGYRLLCCVRPGSDHIVVEPTEAIADVGEDKASVPRSHDCKVVQHMPVTPSILQLTLELPMDAGFRFRPGMYAELHMPGEPGQSRPYSIATAPDADGQPPNRQLTFHIARHPKGRVSPALHDDIAVGDMLRIHGPYGGFRLPDGDGPLLMLGGGTGLAPLLSLAASQIGARDIRLILSVRDRSEVFALDMLQVIARQNPRFRYLVTLTREEIDPASGFLSGRIPLWLTQQVTDCSRREAFVAGPPDFVDACCRALRGAGLPDRMIQQDKFEARPVPA